MMKTKHTPATPLPWKIYRNGEIGSVNINTGDYSGQGYTGPDAAYIAHAANAYPKLVEALREAQRQVERLLMVPSTPDGNATKAEHKMLTVVHTLLRDLGEVE